MIGRLNGVVLVLLAMVMPAAAGEFAQRIAQALGDRTYVSFPVLEPDDVLAIMYSPKRELLEMIAYFEAPEAGADGGRLVIWTPQQKDLQYGTWMAEDFRLCVEPNVFYTRYLGSWRFKERLCIARDTDVATKSLFFAGDVFGLAKRPTAPFELSAANLPEVFRLLRKATPAQAVP